MHSFQHSRARILFEVACAFGISASCVWAWMQTYASAFVPVAAIAALYGLVHAFDMVRRRSAESVKTDATATDQGNLLEYAAAAEPAPVIEKPKFVEPPAEVVAKTDTKRKRKSPRQEAAHEQVPEVVEAAMEPAPEVVETAEEPLPEVAELTAIHVVETAPDEPEYIPTTPLFEPEPFVRQQRAAFGRKAR